MLFLSIRKEESLLSGNIILAIENVEDREKFIQTVSRDIGCSRIFSEDDIFRTLLLCEKYRPQIVVLDSNLFKNELGNAVKYLKENSLAEIIVVFGKQNNAVTLNMYEIDAYLSKPLEEKRIAPTLLMAMARKDRKMKLEQRRRELEIEVKSSKVADFAKHKLKEVNSLDEEGFGDYLASLSRETGKSAEELERFIYKIFH